MYSVKPNFYNFLKSTQNCTQFQVLKQFGTFTHHKRGNFHLLKKQLCMFINSLENSKFGQNLPTNVRVRSSLANWCTNKKVVNNVTFSLWSCKIFSEIFSLEKSSKTVETSAVLCWQSNNKQSEIISKLITV